MTSWFSLAVAQKSLIKIAYLLVLLLTLLATKTFGLVFVFFNQFCHSSVVYRKQTVIEAGLYPNTCPAEDYDLFSSFAKYGKLANVAYPIFRYRISDGSISAQRRDEQNLLAKKLSYRSWDIISPEVISRSEIKQSFNYYIKSSVTDDFGISLKHAYIFILMRVGYRMIKKGNVLQGLHQLWNIASTGELPRE